MDEERPLLHSEVVRLHLTDFVDSRMKNGSNRRTLVVESALEDVIDIVNEAGVAARLTGMDGTEGTDRKVGAAAAATRKTFSANSGWDGADERTDSDCDNFRDCALACSLFYKEYCQFFCITYSSKF